jgi:hypothetical protein
MMIDFEELLAELDPDGEWGSDGFGLDSCLEHCGVLIEQDCPGCAVCGQPNPLRAAGLI